MVSIFQSLKVSLLFIIFGILPLIVAIFAFIILANGAINFGEQPVTTSTPIAIVVLVVCLYIFFVGLLKAIGDITEAALVE